MLHAACCNVACCAFLLRVACCAFMLHVLPRLPTLASGRDREHSQPHARALLLEGLDQLVPILPHRPSQYRYPQSSKYGTRHGEAACIPGLVLRRCQRAGARGATRLRADGMARGAGTPWKVLGGTRGYSWREAQAHLRRYTSVDLDARDFLRTRKQLAVAAASALQLWQG